MRDRERSQGIQWNIVLGVKYYDDKVIQRKFTLYLFLFLFFAGEYFAKSSNDSFCRPNRGDNSCKYEKTELVYLFGFGSNMLSSLRFSKIYLRQIMYFSANVSVSVQKKKKKKKTKMFWKRCSFPNCLLYLTDFLKLQW